MVRILAAKLLKLLFSELTCHSLGCAPFALISLNVLEESATSDDVLKPNEEGTFPELSKMILELVNLP